MHEFGLSESVLDAVTRRAKERRVVGVKVRVGVLHRVDVPAFEQAFSLVSEGSVADGAVVELVVVPVEAHCGSCGATISSDELVLVCPRCESIDLRMTAGEEFLLESIVLAERSEAHVSGNPG